MQKVKSIYFLIIIGFLVSMIWANFNLRNFDKITPLGSHPMIKGDLNLIWGEAEKFKRDILNGKNFFESGEVYTRTFLPSKIIAVISIIFQKKLYEDYKADIIKTGEKFIFLFIQISIYYLSLIFFYKKLSIFISDPKIVYFTILFLSLEPTITQWHSTFWTESIYFSFLILTLSLIISSNKSFINFGLIGAMIGLLYLQKSVSILLIIPLIFYFLFIKIDKKILKILFLVSIYAVILTALGYSNYLKTGIFYVLSPQTRGSAHFPYLLPKIYDEKNRLEKKEKNYPFFEMEKKWKSKNNYNENSFNDKFQNGKYRQSVAIKVMLENKLITTKMYALGIFHHSFLDPFQTYYWHEYSGEKYKVEYHLSDDKKRLIKYRVVYSLIIFLVMLVGVKKIISQKKNILFYLFIFSSICYFTVMLGWIGYTRYFMPSFILMSVLFGNGASLIFDLLKKNDIQ